MGTSPFSIDALVAVLLLACAVRAAALHLASIVPPLLKLPAGGDAYTYRWGGRAEWIARAIVCRPCCTFWLAWPAALLVPDAGWWLPLFALAINGAACIGAPPAAPRPMMQTPGLPAKPPCKGCGGG